MFRKYVEKRQASLKCDNNNGYFTWRPMYIFYHTSLSSSWDEKCFRQKLQGKSKQAFYAQCPLFENRAVYEMSNNIVVPDRPQVIIWSVHIACWIPKATNTHSQYVMMLFHCNNGCTNAPKCYVILKLSALLLDYQIKSFVHLNPYPTNVENRVSS